ncbi:CLUMA_CG011087, isoform A [Clunio marinus]|uniref:CLUMA_CG011087, isoform A n=1 Tax=Clunio marinus TaxID=568069 RepID=A0A1J1IBX9_9DIPT|nr:CLUMA_CG011087, isoform A [Clunio marinus]
MKMTSHDEHPGKFNSNHWEVERRDAERNSSLKKRNKKANDFNDFSSLLSYEGKLIYWKVE